jgi:hypothetical protein
MVVLTQDCDLVHPSYEVEPNVEIMVGALIARADNGLRHGRNPRRLHLDFQRSGVPAVLAFSIHDRIIVPRSVLEDHAPHNSIRLARDERRLLCEWVAKRYVRAAFPDAFNERARAAHQKIEKELKRNGEHVTGLFLMIDPDQECATGQDYRIVLRVTSRSEAVADEKTELILVRLAKRLRTRLGHAPASSSRIINRCPKRSSRSRICDFSSVGIGTTGATRVNRGANWLQSRDYVFALRRGRTKSV